MANLRIYGNTTGFIELQAADVSNDSSVTVNNIVTSNNISNYLPTVYTPPAGTVLEQLSSVCDGSSVTVGSGTYTFTNVTALQDTTTSFVDITGSSISYTPRSEATRVEYEFYFMWHSSDNGGINHFQPMIDGDIVYKSCRTHAGAYVSNSHPQHQIAMRMVIDCNAASTDGTEAKFTSWTTPKTLKVQFRSYSTDYDGRAHYNRWWAGGGATSPYAIAKPYLTIRAIK